MAELGTANIGGRAVPAWVLESTAEEIDNGIKSTNSFSRPNLLDNWYFANPVDQQGGHIVPKGVNYYKVDGFVLQGPIPETIKVDYIDPAGSARFNYGGVACYVPKDGGYVRGYIVNGYGVDRWRLGDGSNGVIQLSSAGMTIIRQSDIMYLDQRIPKSQIPEGLLYTYSVLTSDGLFSWTTRIVNDIYHEQPVGGGISLGYNYTPAEIADFTIVNNTANTSATILAAKLELGPTQTLAHQENGVWVLNEVPNYGDQLRRCQWYSNVLPGIYWLPQNADGTNRLTIPIPDMRTIPAVTYEPTDGSTGTLYYDVNLAQKNSIQFYAIGVTGICGVKNIRISANL